MIENHYYIFHAADKVNGRKESIQCGMGEAGDFLRLIKHKGLLLLNPLHGKGGAGGDVIENSEGNGGRKTAEVWNPVA